MGRHAFLILAHQDFEVLQYLISALDNSKNDLFLHFDQKVKILPKIMYRDAKLYILEERIDVRWGDLSMLKAEFALFSKAKKHGPFQHYHVLSGLHFPLRPLEEIYLYFEKKVNYSVLQKMVGSQYEFDLKLRRFHFFSRNINLTKKPYQKLANMIWRLCLKAQRVLNIRRNTSYDYVKSSQWLSLTEEALDHLLAQMNHLLNIYKYTLCADEFFVATALSNSHLKDRVYYEKNYLQQDFNGGTNPKTYNMEDYNDLIQSSCLFARKFGTADLKILDLLSHRIITEGSNSKSI